MNTQEKVLKVLTLAFQQQDPTSQKQVAEWVKEVQELGEQASEEALLAIQYLQQLQSDQQKAKKGTKIKQKPLIKKKTCSSNTLKGLKGMTSGKCPCVLRRMGGSIIEVDSCTGLPFVKKGKKVVKADKGTAGPAGTDAWYNNTAATGTGTANQKHYYKEGNVWKVQTYNNGAWEDAQDFDISTLNISDKPAFYQNAYAAGYDPETGVFQNEASYNAAFNNKNIAKGQNVIKRIGNAEVTINPYLKTDDEGLQASGGNKVVGARMIGSQKAYINNIKNQIRRTIRHSGLSLKDRIAERKKWGVNVGTKQEGSWFVDFKKNMTDASKQTLNYMQNLQNNPVIQNEESKPSTTTNTTISPSKYKQLVFKTGGKLKIKLKLYDKIFRLRQY